MVCLIGVNKCSVVGVKIIDLILVGNWWFVMGFNLYLEYWFKEINGRLSYLIIIWVVDFNILVCMFL